MRQPILQSSFKIPRFRISSFWRHKSALHSSLALCWERREVGNVPELIIKQQFALHVESLEHANPSDLLPNHNWKLLLLQGVSFPQLQLMLEVKWTVDNNMNWTSFCCRIIKRGKLFSIQFYKGDRRSFFTLYVGVGAPCGRPPALNVSFPGFSRSRSGKAREQRKNRQRNDRLTRFFFPLSSKAAFSHFAPFISFARWFRRWKVIRRRRRIWPSSPTTSVKCRAESGFIECLRACRDVSLAEWSTAPPSTTSKACKRNINPLRPRIPRIKSPSCLWPTLRRSPRREKSRAERRGLIF